MYVCGGEVEGEGGYFTMYVCEWGGGGGEVEVEGRGGGGIFTTYVSVCVYSLRRV